MAKKSAAQLMKDAQKLMQEAERKAKLESANLKSKWEAEAKAIGKTVEEVVGIGGGRKTSAKQSSSKRTPGVAKYLHPKTKKPVDGRVARGDKAFDAYKKDGKLDDPKLASAGLINPEFLKSAKGKGFAKAHKISAK
ncbi:MAG: hypothetical protein WEA84_00830 [Rhodovibrionaceae bacterium]